MKPKRIQRRRAKGWKMPPNTVYVGRPTKWGNPFEVGKDGKREDCYQLYGLLARGYLCISKEIEHVERQRRVQKAMRAAKRELRGKNLACFCPLSAHCHADILLAIANQ